MVISDSVMASSDSITAVCNYHDLVTCHFISVTVSGNLWFRVQIRDAF